MFFTENETSQNFLKTTLAMQAPMSDRIEYKGSIAVFRIDDVHYFLALSKDKIGFIADIKARCEEEQYFCHDGFFENSSKGIENIVMGVHLEPFHYFSAGNKKMGSWVFSASYDQNLAYQFTKQLIQQTGIKLSYAPQFVDAVLVKERKAHDECEYLAKQFNMTKKDMYQVLKLNQVILLKDEHEKPVCIAQKPRSQTFDLLTKPDVNKIILSSILN